jgi:beta-glucosidase
VAGEGAVLLKNEDGILPLRENVSVALLGAFAKTPRYQGAGSSQINPYRLESLHDEFMKLAGNERTVTYADGYPLAGSEVDEAMLAEVRNIAARADVAVVCVGLPDIAEVEGVDRQHMRLPESHGALLEAVAATNSNIVVVLSNGSPVEMPWAAQVKGILEGYLGGQAGGGAIADILAGRVNPSGKLAETFPLRLEDDPSHSNFPGGPRTVEYRESIYVGYRYYDSARKDVRFPFGHGLSYTSFEYSDLELSAERISDADGLRIKVTITNTGTMSGKETVQLYVRDVAASVFRPEKELKGFAKVSLDPAEAQTISFELDRRAFAFYDPASRDWQIEGGEFEILVGASSRDIRLAGTVELVSTRQIVVDPAQIRRLQAYYAPATGFPIDRRAFEALCGRTMPANDIAGGEEYTLNTPIADLRRTILGRLLYNAVRRRTRALDTETPLSIMARHLIEELPLRGMVMMSGGKVTYGMLEGVLMVLNRRFLRGFATLFTEFRRKEDSLKLLRKLGALFMP